MGVRSATLRNQCIRHRCLPVVPAWDDCRTVAGSPRVVVGAVQCSIGKPLGTGWVARWGMGGSTC